MLVTEFIRRDALGPRGVIWVASTELTDAQIETLFTPERWPLNGLGCTLEEARAAMLECGLPEPARAAVEAAAGWQALVRAVYALGETGPWAQQLHWATGLHADFLAYIAAPWKVPGPFPFEVLADDVLAETAGWPWAELPDDEGEPR